MWLAENLVQDLAVHCGLPQPLGVTRGAEALAPQPLGVTWRSWDPNARVDPLGPFCSLTRSSSAFLPRTAGRPVACRRAPPALRRAAEGHREGSALVSHGFNCDTRRLALTPQPRRGCGSQVAALTGG